MPGAFGLLDDPHPSHFPLNRLIENRARLDVFELNRYGAFLEGAVTTLRWGEKPYQLAARSVDILVNGNRVLVDWDVHGRPWFLCPACDRRRQHLYLEELVCRRCAGLDYSSRHLHRTVPGLHRIRRLRREIGVDQRPFAPLPRLPRRHVRFHRIADEITALERGLVGHLSAINQDLERRARLRGMIPR
jgi:hypothetical protein